jgi:RHH-type proline utilization regulon transcriptional repressor/proline dehydrogenase/delta 1-pyrroline-5-carboxylate dehydrogenase
VSGPFVNEPHLELRRASVRESALAALRELDARLPLEVPVLIAGERIAVKAGEQQHSRDPGQPDRVIAIAHGAGATHAGQALASAAEQGFPRWSSRTAADRAATLSRAAAELRTRRLELAALAVREAAKPWVEADADVCEAIDFLEFYAEQALLLDRGAELLQLPGERNRLRYAPRGVTAVIAPWNFPLAIVTGMTAAALAVGNAVVLKPAEQTPACAAAIIGALHRAGVPGEALHLLPGGDAPGAALVESPLTALIAFTGSCAVGLQIIESAARVTPDQRQLKRVVAEMGGKNVIIVDGDADLDDAIPAILTSAFAFAGQKCSAASRVLVHHSIAGALRTRLAGAIPTLQVGPADAFATDVPPVIDAEAQARIARYVELGTATGTVLARAPHAHTRDAQTRGFYVEPIAFTDLPPDSPLLHEEIFGPVLTVESVADIASACALVQSSRFALTGGLFSRSPATIDYVAGRLPTGNLYVNREITGAMVARQPFGGNRLSGTGAKAGGPDYLLHFVEPRVLTENTLRHGLVV